MMENALNMTTRNTILESIVSSGALKNRDMNGAAKNKRT